MKTMLLLHLVYVVDVKSMFCLEVCVVAMRSFFCNNEHVVIVRSKLLAGVLL